MTEAVVTQTLVGVADIYEEVGRRVRRAREAVGLSQAELAQRVRMSRTSITNIEQGGQRIPVHVVFDLANVLGTDIHDLLPDALPPEPPMLGKMTPNKERAWVTRVINNSRSAR